MKKIVSIMLSLILIAFCFPTILKNSALGSHAALPVAVDLRKDLDLPAIGNQGGVGACASYAIGYLQYGNAFSRYARANSITWGNPSEGGAVHNFSPRFTYNLAGSGTAWVYNIIKEQGIPTQNFSGFSGGVTGYAPNDARANNWAVQEGVWRTAQNYRLSGYEQVWIANACNFQVTTSTAGQALLDKVKDHLNRGNVVVTGGYPSRWKTNLTTLSDGGTFGKAGEHVILYSAGNDAGGHQVAIVGYDDHVTCTYNGVTLKGAFLIANSWGTTWQDNGYVWMMYDALNTQSPYAALNPSDRVFTMDQFCFLDWETDIEYGAPELMAELSLTVRNRDDFSITLTRTDKATGEIAEYTPYMFGQEWARPLKNVNFYGNTDTSYNQTTGWLAFNYDELTKNIPAGKTVDDYVWGAYVSADGTASVNALGKGAVTVHTTRLYRNGKKVCEKVPVKTIAAGDKAGFSFYDGFLVLVDKSEGTVVHTENSTLCKNGETFTFTVSAAEGYTVSDALYVTVNCQPVGANNGVYRFVVTGDIILKIEGVVHTPATETNSRFSIYGKGAETHSDKQLLVVNIPQTLPEDLYTTAGNGRYTFRFTVDDREIYDFAPYNFYSNWLVRINIAEQGWIPQRGNSYRIRVEVCENGIPIVTSGSLTFNYDADADTVFSSDSTHTHSYTSGKYIYTSNGNCAVAGTGYEYCNHDNCCAVTFKNDLPARPGEHVSKGEPIVLKNATATTPGEWGYYCVNGCGKPVVLEYFTAAKGDCDGNRVLNVNDATVLINYLASTDGEQTAMPACTPDLSGDGIENIKDLTHLLLMLAGKIS